jgi:NitT/TauT family transport system ATP-binding protein
MSAVPSMIALNRIGYQYQRNSVSVLDSITLSVAPAERVAVIGRSGCGKSTLLQIIAGLLRPVSGAVVINGSELVAPSTRCTLMFQRPLLFPWLTVAKNVALAMRFAGRRKETSARVTHLLELVGLNGLENARISELSGGQQQRVALARSLAVEPEILLLDEPFSSLDAVTRSELRQHIRTILDKLQITFVLVTHDVEDALDLADRVIIMAANPGRILEDVRLPILTNDAARTELRTRLIAAIEPDPASSRATAATALVA